MTVTPPNSHARLISPPVVLFYTPSDRLQSDESQAIGRPPISANQAQASRRKTPSSFRIGRIPVPEIDSPGREGFDPRRREGGSDGKTHARPDRARCVGARVRMRGGRRVDGTQQPGRSRARGGAGDRARHQLFRHRGDVRERRIRAQSRARHEKPPTRHPGRHQGANSGRRAKSRCCGGDDIVRGKPAAAPARWGRSVPIAQSHYRGRLRQRFDARDRAR